MSAKVFGDSVDVLDDQAAVLCEYLNKVASAIVDEEMRIEKAIEAARESRQMNQTMANSKKTQMIIFGVIALVSCLLMIKAVALIIVPLVFVVLAITAFAAGKKIAAEIAAIDSQIAVFEEDYQNIRRDYKVHNLGVFYTQVAQRIPFEGRSFLLDNTGDVAEKEFNLYAVNNQDEFVRNIQELDAAVSEVPIVEGSDVVEDVNTAEYSKAIQEVPFYDYMGTLDRNMRSASFLLNDLVRHSVSLPVIAPDSPYATFLREHSTEDAAAGPVIPVFPTDAYRDGVEKFLSLNDLRRSMEGRTAQFEDFLQDLMSRIASTVQVVTRMKMGSTNLMVDNANNTLAVAFKAAFNHYSPQLEAEEIERIRSERFDYQESLENYKPFELKQSSRVRYDAVAGNWVSEDGRRTSFPFGVLQIHEEIIAPIVSSLMAETRIERLKIYNAIKDQKIDYLNQWHRDTDDFYGRNRAEGAELINRMQSTLTEFTAAFNQYKAFEDTLKSMRTGGGSGQVKADSTSAETVAAYSAQSADFVRIQNEFNDYVDRLKEEIDRRAEQFGYIEFFDASLRDTPAKDYAGAMSRVDSLDERRRVLLAVNPQFAESADLPPRPDISEEVYQSLSVNLVDVADHALKSLRTNDADRGQAAGSDVNTAPAD